MDEIALDILRQRVDLVASRGETTFTLTLDEMKALLDDLTPPKEVREPPYVHHEDEDGCMTCQEMKEEIEDGKREILELERQVGRLEEELGQIEQGRE